MKTEISLSDRYFFARIELFQSLVARLEAKGWSHEDAFDWAGSMVKVACFTRPYWVGGVRVPSIMRTVN